MKKFAMWSTSLLVTGGVAMSLWSAPEAQTARQVNKSFATATGGAMWSAILDLRTGDTRILNPQISIFWPAQDTNSDGFLETVLKVNLDPSSGYTKMHVVLDYEGIPTGYTVNIGDSVSNNGGGGDASTQQRDAEMDIVEQALTVYQSDLGGTGYLGRTKVSLEDSALKINVSDMFLSWGSPYCAMDYTAKPPPAALLFALNGQPDSEGPVNYDIFVGLNRVINTFGYPERVGAGLSKVFITLE